MPRVRTKRSSSLREGAFGLLLASASALAVASASAQDAGGLRGALQPASAAQAPAANQPAPIYIPTSEGAVPVDSSADETGDSLFGLDEEADGTFGDDAGPPAARTPSTARNRNSTTVGGEEAGETSTPERPAGRTQDPSDDQGQVTTDSGGRTEAVGPVDSIGIPDGAGRTAAIDNITPRRREDGNPFAPLGIRVGSFVLRPSIEQGVTVTSNADYSVEGTSAVLSETTLRLNAISDWTQHSAMFDAYGTFRETLSGFELSELRAGALGTLDVDITEELRGRATFGYERAPESASSPVSIEGTAEEPIRQTLVGSLGLEKDVGKARFGITGRVEYDSYGDADLSNGTVLSQKDRNSTLATVTLRGGYEISPALTPFVEIEAGHRFYQQEVDTAGFRRSSDRLGARAGVELDLSEKLTGEVSAGWLREEFEDDRLAPIEGPTLGALLSWSPERATKVDVSATTTVEGTTTPDESGSILHSGKIIVERQIRSNLTANAEVGAGYRDYIGEDAHDILFNAQLGSTWWLNRYVGLTGRLRYESQSSSIEGRNYDAKSVFLGFKVQR